METVNALTIRNNLGKVLDTLQRTKEPILISKGRTIRAVLVTPEDFKRRFIDKQAEEERERLLEIINSRKAKSGGGKKSVDVLRELRGYRD